MSNYKLVIFDWDGTLMDSVGKIVLSMQAAAKVLNLTPATFEQGKSIIGLSLSKGIEQLFPQSSTELQDKIEKEYKYQYLEVNNTPTPLFDNALKLLTSLKESNVLLAVATGKARPGLERVLNMTETEHLFDATRSASDCRSKPDPEMITSLLTELNIDACDAVMIGDTSFDMEMAKHANVDRIGVSFGAHAIDVLNQFEPKAIVHSLDELEKLLIHKNSTI
ncbi:HAD-IA family hydrolase [Pseudocolwellia agarivorans]|uniref:HAD-IA family hydrolase n=1 Tax=Pseudocolwellia agarivorans TaxID=1911682 RepID=UPI0009873B12|nr:HAD-IA family hydrolase [Pseudocolwellia agarivorans]